MHREGHDIFHRPFGLCRGGEMARSKPLPLIYSVTNFRYCQGGLLKQEAAPTLPAWLSRFFKN